MNRQLDKLRNALMSVGSQECDKYCEELETYTEQIEKRQVPVLPIKRSFYDENNHSPAKLQRLETYADNDIDADIDDAVSDDIINDGVGSDDSAAVIIPQVRKVVNSRGRPKLLRTLNRKNAYHFRPSLKQNADVIDLGVHATDKSNLDPNRFVRSYLSNENPLDFKY